MVVKLDTPILNENGEVLKGPVETLAKVITRALLTPVEKDKDSVNKFEVWVKILYKTEAELTAEDIALIKKCIKPNFGPLVVGQAYRLLEGRESGITLKQGEHE